MWANAPFAYASGAVMTGMAAPAAKPLSSNSKAGDGGAGAMIDGRSPRPTSSGFPLYAKLTAQLLVLGAVRLPATFRTHRGFAPHVFGEVV